MATERDIQNLNRALANLTRAQNQAQGVQAVNQGASLNADENTQKSYEFGDWSRNIGYSGARGFVTALDRIGDFFKWGIGGIAGGWFGASNAVTDWAERSIKDDAWTDYATKAIYMMGGGPISYLDALTNKNGYWNDWDAKSIRAQEQGLSSEGKLQQISSVVYGKVGQALPSIAMMAATQGASLGVQAAAQGAMAAASTAGSSAEQALSEGASYQGASGYAAITGAISGAISAGTTALGGSLNTGGRGAIDRMGDSIGREIFKKTGSESAQVIAAQVSKAVARIGIDTGEAAAQTALDPAFKMIYDQNAWYNAYGTEENRRRTASAIGQAALLAAASSLVTNVGREAVKFARAGSWENYEKAYYDQLAESDFLKKVEPKNRREYVKSQYEYQKLKRDIDDIQRQVEIMRRQDKSFTQISDYVSKQTAKLEPRATAWTKKYQGLYEKLFQYYSAKPTQLGGSASQKATPLQDAGVESFQMRLQDLSKEGSLKQALIDLGKTFQSAASNQQEAPQQSQKQEQPQPTAKAQEAPKQEQPKAEAKANAVAVPEPSEEEPKPVQVGRALVTYEPKFKGLFVKYGAGEEAKGVPIVNEKGKAAFNVTDGKSAHAVATLLNDKEVAPYMPNYAVSTYLGDRVLVDLDSFKGKDGVYTIPPTKALEGPEMQKAGSFAVIDGVAYPTNTARGVANYLNALAKHMVETKDGSLKVVQGQSSAGLEAVMKLAVNGDREAAKKSLATYFKNLEVEYPSSKGKTKTATLSKFLRDEEMDYLAKKISDAYLELVDTGPKSEYAKLVEKYDAKIAKLQASNEAKDAEIAAIKEEKRKALEALRDKKNEQIAKIVEEYDARIAKLKALNEERKAEIAAVREEKRQALKDLRDKKNEQISKIIEEAKEKIRVEVGKRREATARISKTRSIAKLKYRIGRKYPPRQYNANDVDWMNFRSNYRYAFLSGINSTSTGYQISEGFSKSIDDYVGKVFKNGDADSVKEPNLFAEQRIALIEKNLKESLLRSVSAGKDGKNVYRTLTSKEEQLIIDSVRAIEEIARSEDVVSHHSRESAYAVRYGIESAIGKRGKAAQVVNRGVSRYLYDWGIPGVVIEGNVGASNVLNETIGPDGKMDKQWNEMMMKLRDKWQNPLASKTKELGISPAKIKKQKFVMPDGTKIPMLTACNVYAATKATQPIYNPDGSFKEMGEGTNLINLKAKGISWYDNSGNKHVVYGTEKNIDYIVGNLPKNVKDLIDFGLDFENGEARGAYEAIFLLKGAMTEEGIHVPQAVDTGKAGFGAPEVFGVRNMSFTKRKTGAVNQLATFDLFKKVEEDYKTTLIYEYLVPTVQELNATMSVKMEDGKSLMDVMKENPAVAKSVFNAIDLKVRGMLGITADTQRDTWLYHAYEWLMGRVGVVALWGKLGAIAKQPISDLVQADMTPFETLYYGARGLKLMTTDKWRVIQEHDAKYYSVKYRNDDNEYVKAMIGSTALNVVDEIGMKPFSISDQGAMTYGRAARASKCLAMKLEFDTKEFWEQYDAMRDRFFIFSTNRYPQNRGLAFQSRNPVARMFSMFQDPNSKAVSAVAERVFRAETAKRLPSLDELSEEIKRTDSEVESTGKAVDKAQEDFDKHAEYEPDRDAYLFDAKKAMDDAKKEASKANFAVRKAMKSLEKEESPSQWRKDDLDAKKKTASEAQKKADDATKEYEEAKKRFDELYDAWMKDGKEKEENLNNAKDANDKAKGQNKQAKANYEFKKKVNPSKEIAAALSSILMMSAFAIGINEVNRRVMGKKKWNEWDAKQIGKDYALQTLTGWIPGVNTLASTFINGYDLEVPGISMINDFKDASKSIINQLQAQRYDATLFTKIGTMAGSLFGLPLKNAYDLVYAAVNMVSPLTAKKMQQTLWGYSYTYEDAPTLYIENRVGQLSSEGKSEIVSLTDSGYSALPTAVPTQYTDEDGNAVKISWSKQQEMKRYYSRANAMLTKLVKSSDYGYLSDEEKAQAIKLLYAWYRSYAVQKAQANPNEKATLGSTLASVNSKDLPLIVSAVAHIKSLEATKTQTKKQLAIAYVNRLRCSKALKMTILSLAGYSVDEKYAAMYTRSQGAVYKVAKA